jgi:uncharacterized protein (DUF427 family)
MTHPVPEPAGPGQESVWDYPRPPALIADQRHVKVLAGSELIASSKAALRLLETAAPPTFYIPRRDIDMASLQVVQGQSFCEWKGAARYWAVKDSPQPVAWDYPNPSPAYQKILGHLAFYPGRVDCFVDAEAVRAQSSEFYGGWITDEIIGPFKGEAGTGSW